MTDAEPAQLQIQVSERAIAAVEARCAWLHKMHEAKAEWAARQLGELMIALSEVAGAPAGSNLSRILTIIRKPGRTVRRYSYFRVFIASISDDVIILDIEFDNDFPPDQPRKRGRVWLRNHSNFLDAYRTIKLQIGPEIEPRCNLSAITIRFLEIMRQ